jgi:hypothetical protein
VSYIWSTSPVLATDTYPLLHYTVITLGVPVVDIILFCVPVVEDDIAASNAFFVTNIVPE